MANPHNVELEAAKFLHKLIQDSTDEPTKLATKLYVILQHMRSSGKENSMPYQVISRAMETVIKQHGLDIEALMSSRLPLAAGPQVGETRSSQVAGSSQRTGVTKDHKASFTANELSKPDSHTSGMLLVGPTPTGHDIYQGSPSNMTGGAGKARGLTPGGASSYQPVEAGMSMGMQFASSSYDNQGFAAKMHKDGMEVFSAVPQMDLYAGKNMAGKGLEHDGGILPIANKLNQGAIPSNVSETSMIRSMPLRDTGKSPVAQAPVSGLPFKEHHLKQLRAQCLVFLAFRNGLMPKKLHLEIALGNFFPKEEGAHREMIDHKGKEVSVNEPNSIPEVSRAYGVLDSTRPAPSTGTHTEGNFSKDADNNTSMKEDKSGYYAVPSEHAEDRRHHLRRKLGAEMPKQETSESQAGVKCDSNTRSIPIGSHEDDSGNNHQQIVIPHHASLVTGTTKPMKADVSFWNGNGCQMEASNVLAAANALTHESQQKRKDNCAGQSQSAAESNGLGLQHTNSNLPSLPLREQWKPISGMDGQNNILMAVKDSVVVLRNDLPAQETDAEEEDPSATADRPSFPKYTTSEKWILDRQKRKRLNEKMWALKQQKTEQKKIAVCSAKLKESMSSSEDIFAKTKRVIELKKLQLLELQRRLRSDILNEFFKPIAPEMDRLKSIKKHRIGRRSKQLERYEQKMKEERQKRIRERQKEFFSEVEVHRERLEDVFKMKRERWKGFNKYVREFHKRKERIHREKIDRIQREKINLLKINDVEGYLRMVQDAKSDRVKQLLKETEKYLQKLGSKLQKAKTMARKFETDVDEIRTTTVVEKNEIAIENEDETDQAKHYMESNEKYYLMAHSVKENVLEQPAMLVGGKLREYQMNGLRWLVSLYNNHLNGILADEMGLGKTVQVISLLCYLMETKNDRGPFLIVVPSSVLYGWESEINFWAPGILKIVYSGPPEERRRLFKEQIVHQKFNVLLTTYEYLMNKHDRPKLSKVQWHYIIIDEGHRIKNASCKLNADLKHYRSNHRLLLTGTPLQNNLEELWALLNFLLPNIFNSSEDFSQWFNKPFESNGDNSPDEALLSEEENLLIINRLHQVLRPFVLRRLKHKVENQLPEKIERLIRCEASAYQKLLMKRVEENLGAIGTSKARSVHNSVMELRNICNHPYLSQLHVEEVHDLIPRHYLPYMVRLCGKLEMLDRLLPKLKATDHRVLLFSTMTRLLDVMEDYLCWKHYKYLRLDGHTSGGDRGALIEQFNQPGSPFFIFLLSIRAGGVGVNLQAADTVIIFDTDWNPQVDLQAQARAHRIGQKRDVLVLRLETVQTVEEQVRASAEHKLGVANQSITAGFFDNNTSAEDRREYLEALLRECKQEEAAPVLDDDALNDLIARSESEIDIFESVDRKRLEEEMGAWRKLVVDNGTEVSECFPPLPSRLLSDDDLKPFYEAMKISEAPQQEVASNSGMKQKSDYLGGLDTRQYGRGKRAREVRSYEEQWTEEEFEKLCQADSPGSPQVKEEITEKKLSTDMSDSLMLTGEIQAQIPQQPQNPIVVPAAVLSKEATPPSKRGRGRPRRTTTELSPSPGVLPSAGAEQIIVVPKMENVSCSQVVPLPEILHGSAPENSVTATVQQIVMGIDPGVQSVSLPPVVAAVQPTTLPCPTTPVQGRGRGRKAQSGEAPRRRGKRLSTVAIPAPTPAGVGKPELETQVEVASSSMRACKSDTVSRPSNVVDNTDKSSPVSNVSLPSTTATGKSNLGSQEVPVSTSTMPAADSFPGSLLMAVPNSSSLPTADDSPSSLVTAGVVQQDPLARTAPANPVTAPAFPSVISGSQSTTLTHPAPVRAGGRGRRAPSGGEAPRRRGKRQNTQAPVTSEVTIDQDPRSVGPPEKKSRGSVGRRPTTRNKQEHDALKRTNVFDSVASLSITDAAIGKVSDSRAEDEAKNSTKMIHSDASKISVDTVVGPVVDDKLDDKTLKLINVVQAGASQGISEPSTIQISKDHEENGSQNHTNSTPSNVSPSTTCLPVEQVGADKPENEAQRQIVESDSLRVLADPSILKESKVERDNAGLEPKDVQLDPSPGIAEFSVTNITENQQGNKTENTDVVQSDPTQNKGDGTSAQASEMEENITHKPACDRESDASKCIVDPSTVQRQESEAERQTNTVHMDASQNVAVPLDKSVPLNDAHPLNNVVESDLPRNIANSSVVEVQDVNQESEAQKGTDIKSDTTAVLSGSGPVVEHADDECCTEPRKEVEEIGEVKSSCVDPHAAMSTLITPVSGSVMGSSDDQVKNEEQDESDSFPEPGCVLNLPTEENAARALNVALNKSDDIATKLETKKEGRKAAGFNDFLETKKEERKEADFNDFLDLKPEVAVNILSQENLASTSGDFEPARMESSSLVCDPDNEPANNIAERNFLDGSLVSDPRLTENRNISEKGVSTFASMDLSGEGVMSECSSGKLGAGEVEQKGFVSEGSQTSDLLNDGTAAPDSEVLGERSDIHCNKTVAEEHEKKNAVLSQKSISVLSAIENVASFPDHAPDNSEDLSQKGDGNDSESKATGSDEVFVLKHEFGAGKIKQKDSVFDGPQTSGILNEAAIAPDSEVLEEISDIHCDKTVVEEHEKQDIVPIQDSISVLSSIENVASVVDHASDMSEDPYQEGDGNYTESKATGSGEVFLLNRELTVIQENSSQAVRDSEEKAVELDTTVKETRNQAREEDANKWESKDLSLVESLVPKSIVEVYSGKADAEELESRGCFVENALVLTHGSAGRQSLEQMRSSTCSTLEIEDTVADRPNVECENQADDQFQLAEVGKSKDVQEAFVTATNSDEIASKSPSAVICEIREDVEEKESSPLQTINMQITCDRDIKEKSEFQSSGGYAAELLKNSNMEVDPVADPALESLKCLEERLVSNAEIYVASPNAREGKSEDMVDSEIVEENTIKDIGGEAADSTLQTCNLKDNLPEMVEVDCDSRADYSGKHEIRDGTLEKDSGSTLEVKSLEEMTPSTVFVLETENSPGNNYGQSETESDLKHIEENTPINFSTDVTLSTMQTVTLKDDLSEIAQGDDDSRRDDSQILATRDDVLEKDSVPTVEVTGAENLEEIAPSTIIVVETEGLVGQPPKSECDKQSDRETEVVDGDASNSNISPIAAAQICDIETKSAANLVENVVNSIQCIEEDSSLSLEIASKDVTPAEDFAEKSEIGSGGDFVAEVQGSKHAELDKTVVADAEGCEPLPCANLVASESKDGSANLLDNMVDSRQSIEEEASLSMEIASKDATPAEALAEKSQIGSGRDLGEVQGSKNAELDKTVVADAEGCEPRPCAKLGASESKDGSANLLDNMVNSRQSIEEEASVSMEIASQNFTPAEALADKSELGSGRDLLAEVQGSKRAELDKTVADAEASEPQPCRNVGASESNDSSAVLLDNMVDSGQSIEEEASLFLELASQDVTTAEVLAEKSEIGSERDFVAEVQRSRSAEVEKTVADAEASVSQPCTSVGASESKDGLQQLVEEYSDMATDI